MNAHYVTYMHLPKPPRRVKRYLLSHRGLNLSERHCRLVGRWLRRQGDPTVAVGVAPWVIETPS